LLPETEENREDVEWVRSEISAEGGDAWVFRSEAVAGFSDLVIQESFNKLRADDYKQLLYSATELLHSTRSGQPNEAELRKLKRRFGEVCRIDFFQAPGRKELEEILEVIALTIHGQSTHVLKPDLQDLNGRTWITRRGVKVDRIASSWLIRRFIDPAAQLRFVDQDRYEHKPGEIRFDMFEGEFTHEGDLCTFEGMLRHTALHDPALESIAEMVHDIDLKDERYQRPETAGFAAMINGIAALNGADEQRIQQGAILLDATYAALKGNR